MRTNQQILDLILQYAQNDDNIRAVVMNGSRVNPNIKPDKMQDFDVVYYVRDVGPLRHNMNIPAYFGDLAIMQLPEEMSDPPADDDGHYAYLMQFKDGHRIDLSICSLELLAKAGEDSLTVVLLDKDTAIPDLLPPSEESYMTKPPTDKQFADCCNEFWWLTPYVAKALLRSELVNARFFLDEAMRPQLYKMLNWYFGTRNDYTKAPGKLGKRWQAEFGPELWSKIEQTYADHDFDHIWHALYRMGDVFRHAAQAVANYHAYDYPAQDDQNVNIFVKQIQQSGQDKKVL